MKKHPHLSSPTELITMTWNLYRFHFDRFIQPLSIMFLISVAAELLLRLPAFTSRIYLIIVFFLIYLIILIWLDVVILRICADVINGKKSETSLIFQQSFYRAPKYFWIDFVYGLIIGLGIILLIVPGIFWAVRYRFAPIAAALSDKKITVREALETSKNLTINNWFDVAIRMVIPAVFFYLIINIVTLGLSYIATGAQLGIEELQKNIYFNLFDALTGMISVPLMTLPLVIMYKELVSAKHKII